MTGDRVSHLQFDVSYSGTSCVGGLSSAGSLGPLAPISNAEFAATSTNPQGGLTWSIAGSFQSPAAATGTLHVTITHANPTGSLSGCLSLSEQVTWVAEKHP